MAYREVTMIEITEVLRQWLAGAGRQADRPALGSTRRPCVATCAPATRCGLAPGMAPTALTEERLTRDPHGAAREPRASARRELAALRRAARLHRRAAARGRAAVQDPPPARAPGRRDRRRRRCTASRPRSSASARRAATIPVADGEPGEELYARHGLDDAARAGCARDGAAASARGSSRPGVSRYRFVYPCFGETTASAIEACEAAWAFLRRRLPRPDPGQHQGDRHDGRSARAPDRARPSSSMRRRAASSSTRRACAVRRTRRASSAACPTSATTASAASGSPRSSRPACARVVWCHEEAGHASPRAHAAPAARALRGRRARGAAARADAAPTTCRCGRRPRSPATSTPRSPRRSTRCRPATSAARFVPAPIAHGALLRRRRRS